jgi:hypothetical protein
MTTATATSEYSHTQRGPLYLLFYAAALACFITAALARQTPDVWIASATGLVFVLFAPTFQSLTVEDRGHSLEIRFGPIPLFRKRVRYADVAAVDVGRTWFFDGWGIHYRLGMGWLWNLWGRDCVILHFQDGRILRIGTDDPANLAEFLQTRIEP